MIKVSNKMNKSKIYLGATVFLLTFAGVYASKAARTTRKLLGYTRGTSSCNYDKQFTQVTRAGSIVAGLTVKTGLLPKTVFTRGPFFSPSCGAVIHYALIN
jgi:hypothetical protein